MSLPVTIEQSTCCVPRITASITPEEAERSARVFKAIGDPTRVMLLSLIAGTEGGEACICDLIEPVGLSQGTVSHHMKLLTDAGLVTREQRGKWAYFALNDGALEAAADALRPAALGSAN
ncbi:MULTISPECIES: ArsR/SmtB family transcription factor [Micrococcales]|jgi:ArsR family transcriptional regulator|uniref:Helix-turn-helix transcriptional regulator n=1 Tax=Microbacterium saccharophilum TaxID=1213358 RepID=A0A5C8I0W2_9MICO|nr:MULTISPECIES: metalloregulator ArsR/SmtB family transcription factor [Micrococcales]MBQ3359777.1 helix-turn-helix transcriptional regulator [Microbacterium sp.]MBS1674225.1 helix-turn-helix transcriptional regulator [Actinomycetota bacterium]PZT88140.1 MAG: transcriptional regulator [Gordonia sp. (in: high G+C Gram-positive bacteria)]OAN36436.1 transcriptional regulator [Microbacterium sp. H83]TXK11194.1 helix-turn-helix transcriptional regulator [Microbacterium saccharophilum]